MLSIDPIREGERVMTICNACRYCEGFCAVFPAMERRVSFAEADMNYLANLCHNCTECIRACQYSPPHQFAVNVPMTLAKIRRRSYEKYCWPRALGRAFRLHGVRTVLGIAALFFAAMAAATSATVLRGFIVPGIFAAVSASVIAVMAVSVARFVKDWGRQAHKVEPLSIAEGLRDPLTLEYLHGSGDDGTVDPAQKGLNPGFILLLILTSATGLALLAWRDSAAMGVLLLAHFALVLTLFVSLPYGKVMHGLHRTAALIRYARESRNN
jgi:citrate/tricarballylate utilization protein